MGAVAGQDKPRTPAANDKIGIGLIGCGGMGRVDLADFQSNTDVDIVAVCDVYEPNANRAAQMTSGRAKIFCDYRNLLDDHASTATCLIGNIALRTGLKLHWDGRNQRFTNSADANRMLTRAYRPPWRLSGLEL